MVASVNSGSFDYSQLGLTTTQMSDAASQVKDQVLTQEDFLKLLTTQLQAQDPTNPADNSEIVSQMSQLSMVDSLNSINTNMSNVIDTVNSSSTMSATNLIGTYVYTDDKYSVYDGGNKISWSIDSGEQVYTNVKLTIKDATTGEVVFTDTADALTGEIKYAWPGIYAPDGIAPEDDAAAKTLADGAAGSETDTDGTTGTEGSDGTGTGGTEGTDGDQTAGTGSDSDADEPEYDLCPPGKYILEVTATNNAGQSVALPVKSLALVTSVTLGKTKEDTMLNLYGHGSMSFADANKVTL